VLPCVTGDFTGVTIPGTRSEPGETQTVTNLVSPDYFKTMEVPIIRDRAFDEHATRTAGTASAVISLAMARRFWPGQDALGKEFSAGRDQMYQVVGIAPDLQNLHLGQSDGPFFYAPLAATSSDAVDAKILMRTAANRPAAVSAIPGIVRQLDANVIVTTESYEQI
jgi:hypothetical protein